MYLKIKIYITAIDSSLTFSQIDNIVVNRHIVLIHYIYLWLGQTKLINTLDPGWGWSLVFDKGTGVESYRIAFEHLQQLHQLYLSIYNSFLFLWIFKNNNLT